MKKTRVFLIIAAIIAVGLIVAYNIRLASGAVTVSRDFSLNKGKIEQWYISSTKETKAHVKITVLGGAARNANSCVLIKGKANATNTTLDYDTIVNRGSIDFQLPFYEGDSNYIQLVGVDVSGLNLRVDVTSHTWEQCFTDGFVESGTDYGIK